MAGATSLAPAQHGRPNIREDRAAAHLNEPERPGGEQLASTEGGRYAATKRDGNRGRHDPGTTSDGSVRRGGRSFPRTSCRGVQRHGGFNASVRPRRVGCIDPIGEQSVVRQYIVRGPL